MQNFEYKDEIEFRGENQSQYKKENSTINDEIATAYEVNTKYSST